MDKMVLVFSRRSPGSSTMMPPKPAAHAFVAAADEAVLLAGLFDDFLGGHARTPRRIVKRRTLRRAVTSRR